MRMNLKKYATLLLTANLTLSGFCGCAATKADSQQLPLKTAVYSNLTDLAACFAKVSRMLG